MPGLTLKKIPEALLGRLRDSAARQRRSLTQEALRLIEHGLDDHTDAASEIDIRRQIELWRDLARRWEGGVDDGLAGELLAARSGGRPAEL